MRITTRGNGWMALGLAVLVTAAGCTTKETSAPDLTGPSELGLSVKVTATPDVLTMDGFSQSTVVVEARNAQGQPASGIGLRAEILVNGRIADLGRLSSKTGTTGGDGRATFTYTAPAGPATGNSDPVSVVTIGVTPSGNDYSNAVTRTVDIRLVPQGVILPPANTPVARFVFSPTAPLQGQPVAFDGSGSVDVVECAAGATSVDQCTVTRDTLVDFAWEFGNGRRGSGARVSHPYDDIGSFTVTLTVTNSRGVRASTSQFVQVGASADPTAEFAFSPENPTPGQTVFFNGAASKASAGRTIVGYQWWFGDGGSAGGQMTSRQFAEAGSYSVTLTVTDDLGKKATVTKSVTVK